MEISIFVKTFSNAIILLHDIKRNNAVFRLSEIFYYNDSEIIKKLEQVKVSARTISHETLKPQDNTGVGLFLTGSRITSIIGRSSS